MSHILNFFRKRNKIRRNYPRCADKSTEIYSKSQWETVLEKGSERVARREIAEFVFSPSSLNSILKCGIQFFYGQLVRIPSPPSEYASYGTAMHGTLRKLIEDWAKKKKWPTEEEFTEVFEYQMSKERGNFTDKQFNNRLQQGKSIIPSFLGQKKEDYMDYPDV